MSAVHPGLAHRQCRRTAFSDPTGRSTPSLPFWAIAVNRSNPCGTSRPERRGVEVEAAAGGTFDERSSNGTVRLTLSDTSPE